MLLKISTHDRHNFFAKTSSLERWRGRKCQGQAMVEYVVLVAFTVLAVLVVIDGFERALSDFFYDVAAVVCLPIP